MKTEIAIHLEALRSARFPRNAICQHHGIHFDADCLTVGISVSERRPGVLVTIYGGYYDSFPAQRFDEWREVVSGFGRIVEEWNGKPGNHGISLVVDREIPSGFLRSIDNYSNLPDVFNLRPQDEAGFAAFHNAFDVALERASAVQAKGGE